LSPSASTASGLTASRSAAVVAAPVDDDAMSPAAAMTGSGPWSAGGAPPGTPAAGGEGATGAGREAGGAGGAGAEEVCVATAAGSAGSGLRTALAATAGRVARLPAAVPGAQHGLPRINQAMRERACIARSSQGYRRPDARIHVAVIFGALRCRTCP